MVNGLGRGAQPGAEKKWALMVRESCGEGSAFDLLVLYLAAQ